MNLKFASLLLLSVLSTPVLAHADSLIFNLSPTDGTTTRSASSGVGQGVIASTTTTISGFSFYVDTPVAEDLKFFITDSTGANILYSGVESIGPISSPAWVESNPLSFTLSAGSEYYFGIVGDGSQTDIGYLFPPVASSSNGLTADTSGNANTGSFSDPVLELHTGGAEIGLQLYAPTAATPEPGSLALLGTGALSTLGFVRRRIRQNA